MDYKYYTLIEFEGFTEACAFSESYRYNPAFGDENTKYHFPVTVSEDEQYCVLIYDLNDLEEEDLMRVVIKKAKTDFNTL